MEQVRVKGLSALNVDALSVIFPDGEMGDGLRVTVTASTATFTADVTGVDTFGDVLMNALRRGTDRFGQRGHPVASVHAVRRKIVKELQAAWPQ